MIQETQLRHQKVAWYTSTRTVTKLHTKQSSSSAAISASCAWDVSIQSAERGLRYRPLRVFSLLSRF